MKRTILHIGTHKTGTTSIQTALFGSRSRLERAGFHYPRRYTLWRGHHPFAWALGVPHKRADPDFDLGRALGECAGRADGKTLILSSEDFSRADRESVAAFIDQVASLSDDIDVVCYFRHPVEYVESLYKWNVMRDFSAHGSIGDFMSKMEPELSLDYHSIASRWHFPGVTKLILRPYVRNVVRDFFAFLDMPRNAPKVRENISPCNLSTRVLSNFPSAPDVDREFVEALDAEIRRRARADVSLLTRPQCADIMAVAEPSLRRLLEEFDVPGGEALLQDRWKPAALDDAAALDVAVQALVEMCRSRIAVPAAERG